MCKVTVAKRELRQRALNAMPISGRAFPTVTDGYSLEGKKSSGLCSATFSTCDVKQ